MTSIRSLVEPRGKAKFCAQCGEIATQEALVRVDDENVIIERYCDRCTKNVK